MNVTNDEHPSVVLRGLNHLREEGVLTDVVLEVEGRSFPCHRTVLASCSHYFHSMFTSGYAEAKQERICIQDVTEVAMGTILDYAYTGCLKTEPDQVQAVMSAARLLQVGFVACKAAEYMKEHLDVSNCADVLMYADILGDSGLVEASERYIASRFNKATLQPSFLQLSLPQLRSLLDRDDLIAHSEDAVVQAALRWIDYNQEERSQHLPALCRTLRNSFISSKLRAEIKKRRLLSNTKLAYSKSRTQRLGEEITELKIFVPACLDDAKERYAPCYDPSTGGQYEVDIPDELESYSMTATPDGDLYMAGEIVTREGYGPGCEINTEKKFYLYNHLLYTWEPRSDMIAQRPRCKLVSLNGYIYAIGDDNDKGMAERYDPSHDEWTSIPPFPLPMGSQFCVVTLGDSIYVIRREGCYSFSTTENRWDKIADMVKPPKRPHAVTFRGSIYCVESGDDKPSIFDHYDFSSMFDNFSTYVETYNPRDGVWKRTGNGKEFVSGDKAILMTHLGTLYLFTVFLDDGNGRFNMWGEMKPPTVDVDQYRPETDSWVSVADKGRLVPGSKCLESESQTDCLVAKMIPLCLRDLEDEVLHQETHEDNSDEESQSGSDDGDI